jgi:gamma-glutamylcyclotransferase (GGCT)/AIG2-like uncharacterized protein YtfP
LALLFVYGTLLPWAPSALGAVERDLGRATTRGQLVDLGGYPGLIEGTGLVHGLLYDLIAEPCATLTWLDVYEGISGTPSDEYARLSRTVSCADGTNVDAWVYMYRHAVDPASVMPSGRWTDRR